MNDQILSLNCRGKLLDLTQPRIMGILNITPDSFYGKSRIPNPREAISAASDMLKMGADILDIGAYSSRPGAVHIDASTEKERLEPVLYEIRSKYPEAILSLDTFRSEIADFFIREYAVDMINDISAGEMDEDMFSVVAEHNLPYILMHMQGTPQNMQDDPRYQDLMKELITYFRDKIYRLEQLGLHDLIIDPGFGFGKTIDQNYQILNKLHELNVFHIPILTGLSRKSMIYKTLETNPEDALYGTTALNMKALLNGAHILRVHDVKAASDVVKVYSKLAENK